MKYEYDEPETAAAEPETPDPRVIALMRVVDLERQHEMAAHKAERMAKEAHIVREELSQARDELSGLLGYPSTSGGVKAMR